MLVRAERRERTTVAAPAATVVVRPEPDTDT
jgi:hypothetical protein